MATFLRAGAVPRLAAMLTSGSEHENGVGHAAAALRRICAAREGRDASVAAGVPAALATAMATCNAGARPHVEAALAFFRCVLSFLPLLLDWLLTDYSCIRELIL